MDESPFLGCSENLAVASIRARGVQISQMISISIAMVKAGRTIDISGLDTAVGQLCASCLDLPPHSGLTMRPFLEITRSDLEALCHQLTANQAPCKSQKAEPCIFHS